MSINGHNLGEINDAIEKAKANAKGGSKPILIMANTVKGEGIDYMAGDYKWHYGAIDENMFKKAQASLENYYAQRVAKVEKEA